MAALKNIVEAKTLEPPYRVGCRCGYGFMEAVTTYPWGSHDVKFVLYVCPDCGRVKRFRRR